MTLHSELIETLSKQKLLPIFRGSHEEVKAALSLMAPLQLSAVELTTTIPQWPELLKELSSKYIVGVGTLKSQSDIDLAIANGAKFLVSFGSFDELTQSNSTLPVIPGAFTPTEFLQLSQAGISIAKLYPASQLGPKYLKDIKVLLPDMNFIVTGGIGTSIEEIQTWLDAGALAVGIGSSFGNPLQEPKKFSDEVQKLAHITPNHLK